MKKLAVFAALLVLSTAAYARDGRPGSSANIATRGGVINSATITQQAGAAAFAQIAQGERAFIDAPRNDPLIVIEPGAFFMPFTGINGDRNNDARVVILDPVGNQPMIDDIEIEFDR